MAEEYKKNVGYGAKDNPTKPDQTDEGSLQGNKNMIKPGATNGYPMTDREKKNLETGAGVNPSPKT